MSARGLCLVTARAMVRPPTATARHALPDATLGQGKALGQGKLKATPLAGVRTIVKT